MMNLSYLVYNCHKQLFVNDNNKVIISLTDKFTICIADGALQGSSLWEFEHGALSYSREIQGHVRNVRNEGWERNNREITPVIKCKTDFPSKTMVLIHIFTVLFPSYYLAMLLLDKQEDFACVCVRQYSDQSHGLILMRFVTRVMGATFWVSSLMEEIP